MRLASIFLASIALATSLAWPGCGSNGADPFATTSGEKALNTAVNNAVNTVASAMTTATNAVKSPSPASANALAQQSITLTQLASAYHMSPSQTSQIQTILQQGTANDQKNGLSLQQQAENTQRRLLVLSVLFGQNPGAVTGQ